MKRIWNKHITLPDEPLLGLFNQVDWESSDWEWVSDDAPVALACGASSQQTQIEASQANFYNEMTTEYKSVFAQNQSILKNLTAAFTPILDKGINQEGFDKPELQTLESGANTGVGQAYGNVKKALGAQEASQGGGNDFLPSGAKVQLQEELGSSAAQQVGNEENQIMESDYATGRQNYLTAAGILEGTASQLNPASFAGAVNQGGANAASTADAITQANNSWMGLVGGALGAAATAYAGR